MNDSWLFLKMASTSEMSHMSGLLRDAVKTFCIKTLKYQESLEIQAKVNVIVDSRENMDFVINEKILNSTSDFQTKQANFCGSQSPALERELEILPDELGCTQNTVNVDFKEANMSWNELSKPSLQETYKMNEMWEEDSSNEIMEMVEAEKNILSVVTKPLEMDMSVVKNTCEEDPSNNAIYDLNADVIKHPFILERVVKSPITGLPESRLGCAAQKPDLHAAGTDSNVSLYKHDGIYRCAFCSFCTEHGSALSKHLTVHRKTMLECSKCELEFTCQSALKLHIKQHHGLDLSCALCGLLIQTNRAMASHMRNIHGDRGKGNIDGFCCKLCGKDFLDQISLDTHVEELHRHDCEACAKKFSCDKSLKKHKCQSRHSKVFQCSGCDYVTHSARNLALHEKSNAPGDLCCDICGKTFVCRKQKRKHVLQHHRVTSEKKDCDLCGKQFHSRQGLYLHKKVAHTFASTANGSQHSYTCHVCGKGFPVHMYLTRHLKTHEDQYPYQCPRCQRNFKYHRNFKSHKDGCLNKSGFPCHVCGKSLKTEYTLKLHMRALHSDKRPVYTCRHCGVTFTYQQSRNKHERTCPSHCKNND